MLTKHRLSAQNGGARTLGGRAQNEARRALSHPSGNVTAALAVMNAEGPQRRQRRQINRLTNRGNFILSCLSPL